MRAQACSILLVSGCARRMPNHLMTQLNLRTFYSSSSPATFARRRCMPIQLDLCQHGSACGTIKRTGQLSPPSADQPLFTAFDPIHKLLGKRMTHGSLCQYSCVHASTSLLKFACFWLRSPHAKSSDDSALHLLLVKCNVCTARCCQYNSLPTRCGTMPPVSSVRPQQISRFSQLSSFGKRMTHGSLCQYSCVHAHNNWLRLPIILTQLGARQVCMPCTTRSMPTQLCMRHNQMRWSAQSALSRSAAFHSFLSNPELLGKRMTHGSLCQYSCVHASTSLPKFACACLRLLHARSSQSSARVVRTLLVNFTLQRLHGAVACQYNSVYANTVCMRHHQTRRSAQSALSRSAAFYSF